MSSFEHVNFVINGNFLKNIPIFFMIIQTIMVPL
jgi:hypothetical protein